MSLVCHLFPAAFYQELPALLPVGDRHEHCGLVEYRILRNVEFGRAGDSLLHDAVKLIISVEHLSVIMFRIDGQALHIRQSLGLNLFSHMKSPSNLKPDIPGRKCWR